jgi:hypothetical protein
LKSLGKIESEYTEVSQDKVIENLHRFYHQVSVQPIRFTAAGFYTINLPLLASVSKVATVDFHSTKNEQLLSESLKIPNDV